MGSLGFWDVNGPFELSEAGLSYGAGISQGIGNITGSAAIGIAGGAVGCVGGKVGAAVKMYDLAGSGVDIARAGADMYTNGINVSNTIDMLAGAAGAGMNLPQTCFTVGTQVVVGAEFTGDGVFVQYVTVSIEDIEAGDFVYSYNTVTGAVEQCEVADTFVRESDHLNYLTISDENGSVQVLETTDEHPFWIVTEQKWVAAKNLKAGDQFLDANGKIATLTQSCRAEFEDGVTVYNFEVADNHNYFIVAAGEYGQTSILVHNECVQRWMSRAELAATEATGLLRGGREGIHFATDAANISAQRARARLALDHTPEVRVTLEVPDGTFSPPSRTDPKYDMPGGGMERTTKGPVQVKIIKVDGKP